MAAQHDDVTDIQLNERAVNCLAEAGWELHADPTSPSFGRAVADLQNTSLEASMAVDDCVAKVPDGGAQTPAVPDAVMAEAVAENKAAFVSCMTEENFHPVESDASNTSGYGFAFTYGPGETGRSDYLETLGKCGDEGSQAQEQVISSFANLQNEPTSD